MATLAAIPEDAIPALSARELKLLLEQEQVSYSGCVEKSEFIALVIATKRRHAQPITPAIIPYFGRQDKKVVDYYKTLGVAKNATIQEITRAYYRLAREFHPVSHTKA